MPTLTAPSTSRLHPTILAVLGTVLALGAPRAAEAQWNQWGGPDRNFRTEQAPLASGWPAAGPRTLWRRALGHGDSAIVAADDSLYTMLRRGDQEVIVALDRRTGETRWEHAYDAPLWEGFRGNQGMGPRATPIVVGDRVCATGVGARLTCLDRRSGRIYWTRDLWEHYTVDPSRYGPSDRGFGASPLVVGDRLITVAGGPGHAAMALDLDDGDVIWASLDYEIGYASPIRVQVDGEEQVVFFMADRVVGVRLEDGALSWEHPHPTEYAVNATTPLWAPGGVLFVSSAYDLGSVGLRLTRTGDRTRVDELWSNRKVQVMHGTAAPVGEVIWASSGGFGPAFLVGVEARSGKEVARMRGFAKANLLASGDRLVLLDELGVLGLVDVGGERPKILARVPLLSAKAWAAPTLVGTTVYARDRKEIVAVDLGH